MELFGARATFERESAVERMTSKSLDWTHLERVVGREGDVHSNSEVVLDPAGQEEKLKRGEEGFCERCQRAQTYGFRS